MMKTLVTATFQALLFGPRLALLRGLAFAALVIGITWLALSPLPPRGASLGWDKANHFAAFAALALAGRLAWPRAGWPALALALLAYGGGIELLQWQLPPREGDLFDLLADGIGIALGLAFHAGLRKLMAKSDA